MTCGSLTGLPWWPMPWSLAAPQPLTVSATIASGRWPFWMTGSSSSTLLMLSGLWPSITRTMNPYAISLSAVVSLLCWGET